MVTRFKAWLAQATSNLDRIGKEPILAVGLAIEAFYIYQEAASSGLAFEDAAGAAVIGVLIALGRQLVYPAVKVDAATSALKEIEEEVLGEPYIPPEG